MRRGIAVGALIAAIALVAVIVLVTMGGGSQHAARRAVAPLQSAAGKLQGQGFTTTIPAGWRIATKHGRREVVRYQLSSSGAPINALGLPPAGTVGVTIDDVPASLLATPTNRAPRAIAVLRASAGTPRGASRLSRVAPPRPTILGDAEAAEEVFLYTYRGRENIQVDIVAQHGGRSMLIELDAAPSLSAPSRRALEVLASGWRWR